MVEEGDPQKTIDEIIANAEAVSINSELRLTKMQPFLWKDHKNEWVALRQRYGAEPFIYFAAEQETLMDTVQRAHPQTWSYFAYRKLISPHQGNIEGH